MNGKIFQYIPYLLYVADSLHVKQLLLQIKQFVFDCQ